MHSPLEMHHSVKTSICDVGADPCELASFFCKNLTREYLSHSELQSDRTTAEGDWVPDIEEVIARELRKALHQDPALRSFAKTWNGVFVSMIGRTIAGVAIVLYVHDDSPYGIIEDIVVDEALRGRGVGTAMINAILADMRSSKLSRAFLESGDSNYKAHDLFHKIGFKNSSVTMAVDL